MAAGKSDILFSDLDGTLIFSAKLRRVGDVVIDRLNGEPISCITARQAELLPRIRRLIPVTSRSIEQFRRIEFPEGFAPEYALCSNGGTLLVNGVPDSDWTSRSAEFFAECETELDKFRQLLENDPDRIFDIRLVDGLFLFTKSARSDITLSRLGAYSERCDCFAAGRKVYVIPKKLAKGCAVKRLAQRLGLARENIFCAGDSLVDVSMLSAAGTALFTDDIPERLIAADRKLPHPREGFAEFVTDFTCGKSPRNTQDLLRNMHTSGY